MGLQNNNIRLFCFIKKHFLYLYNKIKTMENLKIDKETAKKIYPTAPAEIKLILEQTFGKGFFSENIMDKVKSVEDAIAIFGDSHEEVIKLNKLIRTFGIGDNLTKYQMLKIVRDVLNEGWVPDWDNKNEHKWYPYYNSVMVNLLLVLLITTLRILTAVFISAFIVKLLVFILET
jgi:hypothetical protein